MGTPALDTGGAGELEWRTPSRQLLKLRRLEVIGATAIAAIVVALVVGGHWGVDLGAGAVVLVLLGGAILFAIQGRRYASWGYAEREDDLLVRRGVMFARFSVVPYGRMQFVDVTAGPLERSLGLATVKMHTAAAASDARIPGLERAEADRLRDQLAELGEAKAAGI